MSAWTETAEGTWQAVTGSPDIIVEVHRPDDGEPWRVSVYTPWTSVHKPTGRNTLKGAQREAWRLAAPLIADAGRWAAELWVAVSRLDGV